MITADQFSQIQPDNPRPLPVSMASRIATASRVNKIEDCYPHVIITEETLGAEKWEMLSAKR